MIDITKLIVDRGLELEAVAKELFPSNNYPMKALKRVLDGKALLNTKQVFTLSEITGVSVASLFNIEAWDSAKEGNTIVFKKGAYTATYHPAGSTVISNGERVISETLLHKNSILLTEYFELINEQIKNYENAKDHD